MAEVLSQNEIDALLAAVSTGDVPTENANAEAKKSQDYVAYDLTTQEKSMRGKLVGLDGIHERFSRSIRVSLSNLLKKNVSSKIASTEYVKFGDYLSNILLPASLNIIEMPQLRGHVILVATSKLTYALVDAYYGGSERPFSKIGGREQFTVIENNMIRKVTDLAVTDLEAAWKLNYPVKMQFQRSESNPQFIGCIHMTETVAVVTFDIEFESLSGPLALILQMRPLEAVHSALSVNMTELSVGNEAEWRQHWNKELMELELDCRVELGSTEKKLSEIKQWKKEDVIGLKTSATGPLDVYVEGQPKFKGLLGSFRGNHALRINSLVGEVNDGTSRKE